MTNAEGKIAMDGGLDLRIIKEGSEAAGSPVDGSVEYEVTARLSADGNVRVAVLGRMSYGSRSVTATVEVADEKVRDAVKKALVEAKASGANAARRRALMDAGVAMAVALTRGEEI